MDRSSILLVVLFAIFASVVAQTSTSTYDCSKGPRFSPDVKNCCKRPTLNIDKYKAACYPAAMQLNPHAYMDPCGVECVFTKSGALNNGTFNYVNLQTLLGVIMPNDPDLAKLFLAGFKVCAPDVQAKLKAMQSKNNFKFPGQSKCSTFAVTTSFCAMRYVFINCPSNLWTSSDTCNAAQLYVKNCDPLNTGGRVG